MTTDRMTPSVAQRSPSLTDILLDGMFTGMIGALVVAIWFLILDTLAGRPLYTPSLLGQVLLNVRAEPSAAVTIAPLPIAAYTAFHFVAFIAVGILFSWSMNLFERFPIMFFVLLVSFLCLQVGVFALDAVLGSRMIGRLQPWSVIVANLLASAAMAVYQWKQHPSVIKNIDKLWTDDPGS
jgi:hypothetical protein